VIMSLLWKRMNGNGALAGMIVGAVTVIIWIYGGFEYNGTPLNDVMYAIVPAFILSLIAIVVGSLVTAEPNAEIQQQFDAMEKGLKS
ncbi:MAG: sodium:proline symporter, partial [Moraxellaceae bacterium]|nr:sodium:proline symporter [Moraxellaceae bacterium]